MGKLIERTFALNEGKRVQTWLSVRSLEDTTIRSVNKSVCTEGLMGPDKEVDKIAQVISTLKNNILCSVFCKHDFIDISCLPRTFDSLS